MDDSLQFSEDDIRQQLNVLGYHNIPASQLQQFAQDLERLIRYDKDREKSIEVSITSESDQSVDDTVPVSIVQGSVAAVRPASAPSYSRKMFPSKIGKSARPGSSQETNYPAKHPKPFSYRYDDTAIAGLDTTDDSRVGRERQEGRRSGEKKSMKRKVVRKTNGQVQIFDESITDSESGDLHDVSNQLSHLALRRGGERTEEEDDDEATTLTDTDDRSSLRGLIYTTGRPRSSKDLYSHRPGGDENTVYKPHLPRSFIRPDSARPRARHDKKTDPVSRHQMYQAEWSSHQVPGEKNRNNLRWSIREQMMYKDTLAYPQRAPRVYSANSYVVPTDKKRQALRWAVRTSLAHKQMPFSTFY